MLINPIQAAARRSRLPEAALAMGLCLAMILGTSAAQTQRSVAEKLVRLHILANSDSDHDQAVKLRVRDDLLARMAEMDAVPAPEQLEIWANQSLAEQGETVTARAVRTRMYFDTREYETFALPAGYIALLSGLGVTWVGIGAYVLIDHIRTQKRSKNR